MSKLLSYFIAHFDRRSNEGLVICDTVDQVQLIHIIQR